MKCSECKYEGGFSVCIRDAKKNEFTDIWEGDLKDRTANNLGECKYWELKDE